MGLFILYLFLISLVINLLFFIIAFLLKTDIFTDITYALTFISIIIIVFAWKQQFSISQIVIFLAVLLWGIRLGSYLLTRIIKIKVDHRFDKIRTYFLKFLGFWILQAITVFLIILPSASALNYSSNYFNDNNPITYIFVFLALLFLLFETISDYQKYHFYNNPNHEPYISKGLWKISRHPNYFGEIGFWYCLAIAFIGNIIITNTQQNNMVWINILWILSPLYINLLLLFVSGLPMLETKSYQKLSNNLEYNKYVIKTSIIIPWVGKKGNIIKVRRLIKK